jgi:hypothetical protein
MEMVKRNLMELISMFLEFSRGEAFRINFNN